MKTYTMTHAVKGFPLKNFLYLMKGRGTTMTDLKRAMKTLLDMKQIPEMPYLTKVRIAKGNNTIPGVYIDLGYGDTVEQTVLVVPLEVDCDGDCTGVL